MNERFEINVDGRRLQVSAEQIGQLIRQRIRASAAMMSLFEEFEVAPERLDELQFVITELDQKYAETDARMMKINSFLFEGGDFFDKHFYIIAHEIIHWLSRIREEDAYLNDPEEVLGFVASIAYEIEQGLEFDAIWNKIYAKINWHFHNESDAREFFSRMMEKAVKLLKESKQETGYE